MLAAMGLDRGRIDSSLRLSFSRFNTKEEIEIFAEALESCFTELTKRP